MPHFTINWAYTTRVPESWYIDDVVMSCLWNHVLYCNQVSICISIVHVSVSIRNISIRGIRYHVILGMEVKFGIRVLVF